MAFQLVRRIGIVILMVPVCPESGSRRRGAARGDTGAAFAPVAPPVLKSYCIGLLLDAMKPGIHCVGTHWIRGFMAFQLVQRIRAVRLMVPT